MGAGRELLTSSTLVRRRRDRRFPVNMTGQLHLTCEAGQRYFLTTSAAAECRAGQKLRVFASGSVFAHDPNSGETLLHVLSMDRVYTLLGHRDSGL